MSSAVTKFIVNNTYRSRLSFENFLNGAGSDAGGVAPMDAAGAEFIWQ